MSEKVIVPREVAEALDVLLDECPYEKIDVAWAVGALSIVGFVDESELKDWSEVIYEAIQEGNLTYDELLAALVDGYEPEPTPEEIVRVAYERAKSDVESCDYGLIYVGKAFMEAIEMFADAYNIKIPGVNAPDEGELD